MNLLAEIYSHDQMIPKTFDTMGSKETLELDLNEIGHTDDLEEGTSSLENPYMLSTLAPRLWPFMRHSISSVRLSAIRTLVVNLPILTFVLCLLHMTLYNCFQISEPAF